MNESEKLHKVKELAKRLKDSTKVTTLCLQDEPGEWSVAYSFVELEEAFQKTLDLLAKLSKKQSKEALEDTLLELGEEFRHIIYHIQDNRHYSYLFD